MTNPIAMPTQPGFSDAERRSLVLVFLCTLIGAVAQLLVKLGTTELGSHVTLPQVILHPSLFVAFALGLLTNFKMFIGYGLYGFNTLLMAIALKGRELSRLYPIIALTYVWVTILSLLLLTGERLTTFRMLGIAIIVGGVSILGARR